MSTREIYIQVGMSAVTQTTGIVDGRIELKQEGIALISYLVKEIKLYNDKAEIIFNSPLKKSPNSDSYFLYRTKYMFKPVQHHLPLKIEMKVSYAV